MYERCTFCGTTLALTVADGGPVRCAGCERWFQPLVDRLVDRLARREWSDWPASGACSECGRSTEVASIGGDQLCLACAEALVI